MHTQQAPVFGEAEAVAMSWLEEGLDEEASEVHWASGDTACRVAETWRLPIFWTSVGIMESWVSLPGKGWGRQKGSDGEGRAGVGGLQMGCGILGVSDRGAVCAVRKHCSMHTCVCSVHMHGTVWVHMCMACTYACVHRWACVACADVCAWGARVCRGVHMSVHGAHICVYV